MNILHEVYRCFVTCCMLQQNCCDHTQVSQILVLAQEEQTCFFLLRMARQAQVWKRHVQCYYSLESCQFSIWGNIVPIQASLPSKHFTHKLNHKPKFGCHLIRHNKFVDVTKWLHQQKRYYKNPKNCAHMGKFEDDGQS